MFFDLLHIKYKRNHQPIQMNPKFLASHQSHENSKYNSPSRNPSPPKLTRNTPSTNSNTQISDQKDDPSEVKPAHTMNNHPSIFTVPNQLPLVQSPPVRRGGGKHKTYFLESKPTMKDHIYIAEYDHSEECAKGLGQSLELEKKEKRLSQSQQIQMKSTKEIGKVPAFLQDKIKRSQFPPSNKNNIENQKFNKFQILKPKEKLNSSLQGSVQLLRSNHGDQLSKSMKGEWFGGEIFKVKEKKFHLTDFQQIKELGSGKYGKVFLVRQKKTNFICALKMIEKQLLKEEQITEQFTRELKIQMFLHHPNIIKMYGFFDDAQKIYILLEVATNGQLFKQLKKHQCMPEKKVAQLMRQVCQGVNELHFHSIIHRDIKPENIVMHEKIIKLCDFGWSVRRDEHLRNTFCGTPLYVSPQILRGKEYDEKIDIWSLGIMMYEMLIGESPFKITKQEELVKIIKENICIPSYVSLSAEAISFLDACLQKNPDQRLNIRQLLNHEFFKKYPEKVDKKNEI